MLIIRPKESAVTNYRYKPLLKLGAKFRKSLLRKNDKLTIGELAERFKKIDDVWVVKYLEHAHTADVLFSMRNAVKSKIIMDIDDSIWANPNCPKEDAKRYFDRAVVGLEMVKASDKITVSTEPLKEQLKDYNDDITVLPNLIDPKDWKFKRKKHDKIRIGWIYSPTHARDVAVVREALREVWEHYQDKIEIVIFGTTIDILDIPFIKEESVRYDQYPKKLTELSLDISIAPLENNEWNKCKSNIKWLESTMAGAAFIGSAVYPYYTSIRNRKTGFIAKNKKDWINYLSLLIENEEKRKEIVENAKKDVLEFYNIEKDNRFRLFYENL